MGDSFKQILKLSSMVLVVAAVPGCIDPAGGEDGDVSEATSELSIAGGATWGTTGNNGPLAQLGPTSSQTCFLSGVSGDFVGNPGLWGQPGSFLPASAEVFPQNGTWFIRTKAGIGPGVLARVTCINVPYNPNLEFSWSDNLTSTGIALAPNRHCFLRSVWATGGLSGSVLGTRTGIQITKRANEFDMNDSAVENIGGDFGYGGGTAVCVDVPTTAAWGFTLTGPSSGSTTITLRNSFPNGTPVPVANVGCFMTGITGRWVSPSPDPQGWNDGAFLIGDPSVSVNWQMTASNGRTGIASCIE